MRETNSLIKMSVTHMLVLVTYVLGSTFCVAAVCSPDRVANSNQKSSHNPELIHLQTYYKLITGLPSAYYTSATQFTTTQPAMLRSS